MGTHHIRVSYLPISHYNCLPCFIRAYACHVCRVIIPHGAINSVYILITCGCNDKRKPISLAKPSMVTSGAMSLEEAVDRFSVPWVGVLLALFQALKASLVWSRRNKGNPFRPGAHKAKCNCLLFTRDIWPIGRPVSGQYEQCFDWQYRTWLITAKGAGSDASWEIQESLRGKRKWPVESARFPDVSLEALETCRGREIRLERDTAERDGLG